MLEPNAAHEDGDKAKSHAPIPQVLPSSSGSGMGHTESGDAPPYLMENKPWYPGDWAPPGEMLTWASFLVGVAAVIYIFLTDGKRAALFRFPTGSLPFPLDLYYMVIAALTAVLAWAIFNRCLDRPGPTYPRWYALILALICTGIALYALIDRFLLGTYRGSPMVHGSIAAAAMAVLTLWPRLLPALPYQRRVRHMAPVALTIVLFIGLPSARAVSNLMIDLETRRVKETVSRLSGLANEIRGGTNYAWNTMLEKPTEAREQVASLRNIKLTPALPDPWVWDGAALLGLTDELRRAVGDLAAAVSEAIAKVKPPRLGIPSVQADMDAKNWRKIPGYDEAAATTAAYYKEVQRLFTELGAKLPKSPAREVYAQAKLDYDARVKVAASSFGEHWLVPIVGVNGEKPLALIDAGRTNIGATPLVDFKRWKSVPFGLASQLHKTDACTEDPFRYTKQHNETRYRQEGNESVPYTITITDYYYRIECYAYSAAGEGASTLAQLHLLYKLDSNLRSSAADPRLPVQVALYWTPPRDTGATASQSVLLDALAKDVRGLPEGEKPDPISGGTFDRGFSGSGYKLLPSPRGEYIQLVIQ